MVSFPNAKINLGLNIVRKRSDGYHDIESCLYPIPYYDMLEIIEGNSFEFTITGIPINEDNNLVTQAYYLLTSKFDLPPVRIHLNKNIPVGGGLGGGSSNASFTLKMLNEIFHLNLKETALTKYASQLGSDCSFFIKNNPMMVSGKGEILEDLKINLTGYYLSVVTPQIQIKTGKAYNALQPKASDYTIKHIIENESVEAWKKLLHNDFEKIVVSWHPEIEKIKQKMMEHDAIYSSLTGSGSSVFGIFDNKPVLENIFPNSYFIWTGKCEY